MRQNGLEAAVLKKAAGGTPIWGICGGYQKMCIRDRMYGAAGIMGLLALVMRAVILF